MNQNLLLLFCLTTKCFAFNQQRSLSSSSCVGTSLCRFPSQTVLFLDLVGFFGGKKTHSTEDGALTGGPGSTGGVAEIMDSMNNLESAQRMGKLTTSLFQDLQSSTVEGSSQDGKVKVLLNCQQKPVRVSIDEGYYAEVDANEMAASLTVAMQDAYDKSIDIADQKMRSLYSELGLSPS